MHFQRLFLQPKKATKVCMKEALYGFLISEQQIINVSESDSGGWLHLLPVHNYIILLLCYCITHVHSAYAALGCIHTWEISASIICSIYLNVYSACVWFYLNSTQMYVTVIEISAVYLACVSFPQSEMYPYLYIPFYIQSTVVLIL